MFLIIYEAVLLSISTNYFRISLIIHKLDNMFKN